MRNLKKVMLVPFTVLAIFASGQWNYVHIYIHELGHAYGSVITLGTFGDITLNEDFSGYHTSYGGVGSSHTSGAYTFFFLLAILSIKWFGPFGIIASVLFIIGGVYNFNHNYHFYGPSDFDSITPGVILLWAPYHIGIWFLPDLFRAIKKYRASKNPIPQALPRPKKVQPQTPVYTRQPLRSPSSYRRELYRSSPRN